jgi:hypothetical protein
MSRQLIAVPLSPRLESWLGVWFAAVARPSVATYQGLASRLDASARRGLAWVLMAGLAGGLIDTVAQLLAHPEEGVYVDGLLLVAIGLSALLATLYVAAFAACTYVTTRLLRAAVPYRRLAYLFSSLGAPLLLVGSVLARLPGARALLIVLYVYWLGLYFVALRAASELSAGKTFAALLGALLMLGLAWLGLAFLVGYSGILLP